MWKCKECGEEVEMTTVTLIEKTYKLKRDVGFAILKSNSTDERISVSYYCTNCNSNSKNIKDIAEWEED